MQLCILYTIYMWRWLELSSEEVDILTRCRSGGESLLGDDVVELLF
jgi:hypothetical protein